MRVVLEEAYIPPTNHIHHIIRTVLTFVGQAQFVNECCSGSGWLLTVYCRRKDFPYYYRNTNKYPSQEEQRAWVETYLATYREKQTQIEENNPVAGQTAGQESSSVNLVLREVEVFSLDSHLLWTLWSLKQAQNSNIPFAYYSLARDKVEDYRSKKQQVDEAKGLHKVHLLSSL